MQIIVPIQILHSFHSFPCNQKKIYFSNMVLFISSELVNKKCRKKWVQGKRGGVEEKSA